MGRILVLLGMGMCVAFAPLSVHADVIYDNGDPNGYIGLTSTYEVTILDDFELEAGASTLTDFHWYGAYYDDAPQADNFTLYIFDGSFNLLETIDGSAATRDATGGTVDVPIFGGDYDEYYYELLIDPIALNAGTTYYLGIANANDSAWAWEYASILSGDAALWFQQTDSFVEGPGEFAYELTGQGGVVPEPTSLGLLGFGLAGLALRRRNKSA